MSLHLAQKSSGLMILTLDRRTKTSQSPPKTQRAERTYARQLKSIAQHVGEIINGFEPGDVAAVPSLTDLLRRYADALTPWAQATASKMLGEVNERDRESWRALGNALSAGLRNDIEHAPVGERLRELLSQQVTLIQSIPIDAAQRVHDLTIKGLENSTRASDFAKEIMRSGEVATSHALLIARTEVSRTASALTQTRAEYVGLTHYIWRTSNDGDVRPGHKAMNRTVCEWAHPPAVNENGRVMHHHPGQIWNCRCWPEPVINDD